MLHDFRFGLAIVTTRLASIALNVFFTHKNPIIKLALYNANSVIEFVHVEKTFRTLACQMCGYYSNSKSEIMKHYQNYHVTFFHMFINMVTFQNRSQKWLKLKKIMTSFRHNMHPAQLFLIIIFCCWLFRCFCKESIHKKLCL